MFLGRRMNQVLYEFETASIWPQRQADVVWFNIHARFAENLRVLVQGERLRSVSQFQIMLLLTVSQSVCPPWGRYARYFGRYRHSMSLKSILSDENMDLSFVQFTFPHLWPLYDRLCGLVVRVLGYRSGGPGSIPGTTRKTNVVGLERGPLSLVSTTEELLDRKVAAPV
jgi:hypothetical protein